MVIISKQWGKIKKRTRQASKLNGSPEGDLSSLNFITSLESSFMVLKNSMAGQYEHKELFAFRAIDDGVKCLGSSWEFICVYLTSKWLNHIVGFQKQVCTV